MGILSRAHGWRRPIQGFLLLCILLLGADKAWAAPQANAPTVPSEETLQSVLQYACVRFGPTVENLTGEDMQSGLVRARLPFALIGMDESFFHEDAVPTLMPDTSVAQGELLCAITLPEEAVGAGPLPRMLFQEIYVMVSLASGQYGIGFFPPIEFLPDPPAPSAEDLHQVFRYGCRNAGPKIQPVLNAAFAGLAGEALEVRTRIAWAAADIEAWDLFSQAVAIPMGTELCVIDLPAYPEETFFVSWPHGTIANTSYPALTDRPLPALPTRVPGDGTWIVGRDMAAGLYRSAREFPPQTARQGGLENYGEPCAFRLLRGFGGRDQDVVGGRGQTYARVIVQLDGEVRGLATEKCGAWERIDDKTLPAADNGTRRVGLDMEPGLWRARHSGAGRNAQSSSADGQCRWMLLEDFLWVAVDRPAGVSSSVRGQNQGTTVVVDIPPAATGFHSEFCADWIRVE